MPIRRHASASALSAGTICLLAASLAWGQMLFNLDEYEKATGKKIKQFNEAPMLKAKVAAGKLPPVEERLPENPIVMEPWERTGKYGGTLNYCELTIDYCVYLRHINDATLTEFPPSASYSRYGGVCGGVFPGVLESWEISNDARTFTLRMRKGLKWSDGVPVTTDDVRYTLEDVCFNKEITPVLQPWARWGGKPLAYKILDDYTFRLTFAKPFGTFIKQLRDGRWHMLMRPKHYLRRFHKRYTPPEKLKPTMKEQGYSIDEWGRFYNLMDNWNAAGKAVCQAEVMSYPTLDPWVVVSRPNATEMILERNPYFYKVDTEGNQLPYMDGLHRRLVTNQEIENLKILSGESDMQGYFIKLADYPLFMKNRKKGGYNVMLLKTPADMALTIVLNLCPDDPVLRAILQDVRFRRAISLSLDREEINEALFLGLGRPAQATTWRGSPYYEEEFEKPYIDYDPDRANRILDEMGLDKRDKDGYRLRPDGKRLTLGLTYYVVTPVAAPGAELTSEYLREVGIYVPVREVNGSLYGRLHGTNDIILTVRGGGGRPTSKHGFSGLAIPAPMWWKWHETDGRQGVEPLPAAKRAYQMREIAFATSSETERTRACKEILRIQSENLWQIGTVAGVKQPFVYSKRLGNISVAKEKDFSCIPVLEAAEQWYFKR